MPIRFQEELKFSRIYGNSTEKHEEIITKKSEGYTSMLNSLKEHLSQFINYENQKKILEVKKLNKL